MSEFLCVSIVPLPAGGFQVLLKRTSSPFLTMPYYATSEDEFRLGQRYGFTAVTLPEETANGDRPDPA